LINNLSCQSSVIFDTPGTHSWIVPDCVTEITVQVWGGGGGGGAAWSRFTSVSNTQNGTGVEVCVGAGGGGGGGFAQRTYSVIPGQIYTIVVGNGGNGGIINTSLTSNQAQNGSTGGSSTFSGPATAGIGVLTATGGTGGGAANASRACSSGCAPDHAGAFGTDGGGGSGSNGTITFTGGNGRVGNHCGSSSCNSNDMGGGGGGGAGTNANGGNAGGNSSNAQKKVAGIGGLDNGGNGATGPEITTYTALQQANGNSGNTLGGGGSGAAIHNRRARVSEGTNHATRIGGNGARGEVRITFPEPGSNLQSNGSRIAPLGPMCSGSTLNFISNPSGGDGNYVYSWSTTPASSTSSSNTFSPTLTNTGCTETTYSINLSVTSCGVTRNQTFSPTIRPIPSLSGSPFVDCEAASVQLNPANINACAGCTDCIYTLASCAGCTAESDPVGTTNTTGSFTLNGASSASFTVSTPPLGLNQGCSSSASSHNFLGAPHDCSTPLPVEFSDLKVDCNRENLHIEWVTHSESNNHYFTLEKSTNATDFQVVDNIYSYGNSSTLNTYTYLDQNIDFGTYYYRLSQTDFDGTTVALDNFVVNLPCEKDESVTVFPNPTDSNIKVIVSAQNKDIIISTFNSLGQLVQEPIIDDIKNQGSKYFEIQSNDFASGVYFVQVILGNETYNLKVVKK
jgi:hypothetical protein